MREELQELLEREPFIPFRIKLINGDAHDIPDPRTTAMLERTVYIATRHGEWVEFKYNRIASLESLLEF